MRMTLRTSSGKGHDMKIKIEKGEGVKVIKITGDIIMQEIKKFEKVTEDLGGVNEIHVDLSEVSYANSSFLNLLINIKNKYPKKKIKIVNPNDFLLELLSITDFKSFFEIITK